MSYYPPLVHEHFSNPRNVGEVACEDAYGDTGSLVCGAVVRLSLKIDAASHRITEAKFKGVGCGFLIASASVLTEIIKGMVLGEAAHLSACELAEKLGGLPPDKLHCAELCQESLHEAAVHYRRTSLEEWVGEEALICTCFGVSEKTIERVIHTHSLRTIEQVTRACNAGGGCGSCHPLIEDILEDHYRNQGRNE